MLAQWANNIKKEKMMGKISTYRQTPTVFDSLFDGFLTSGLIDDLIGRPTRSLVAPRVETTENKDSYIVSLAAPGTSKSDFNVTLKDRMITLDYTKGEESPTFFNHSSFRKTWSAPRGTKSQDISAEYVDGVLNIVVKKASESEETAEVIDII